MLMATRWSASGLKRVVTELVRHHAAQLVLADTPALLVGLVFEPHPRVGRGVRRARPRRHGRSGDERRAESPLQGFKPRAYPNLTAPRRRPVCSAVLCRPRTFRRKATRRRANACDEFVLGIAPAAVSRRHRAVRCVLSGTRLGRRRGRRRRRAASGRRAAAGAAPPARRGIVRRWRARRGRGRRRQRRQRRVGRQRDRRNGRQ